MRKLQLLPEIEPYPQCICHVKLKFLMMIISSGEVVENVLPWREGWGALAVVTTSGKKLSSL